MKVACNGKFFFLVVANTFPKFSFGEGGGA